MKKDYCKGCYYLLSFNGRCLRHDCAAADIKNCNCRQIVQKINGCGDCTNKDPYNCLDCQIYQSLPYVQ